MISKEASVISGNEGQDRAASIYLQLLVTALAELQPVGCC